jgi:hypothetical protein
MVDERRRGITGFRPMRQPTGEGADPGHIGAGEFGHEAKPRARLSESAVDGPAATR